MKSLLSVCFIFAAADSARILGVLHVPTQSHYIIGRTIMQELANKGHDVTLVSPFKSKEANVNFREIYLDGVHEIVEGCQDLLLHISKENIFSILSKFSVFTNALAEAAMRSPQIQKLIKSGEKFDVVIVEPFSNEALFGLFHIFNSHLIILSTANSMWVNTYAGNVAPYSFVPHTMTPYTDTMSFKQRFLNSLVYISFELYNRFLIWPVQKSLYEEMFENVPPFEETIRNVTLVLVNTHVVFETPRPYMPNMIPISGAHIKEPKKLPKNLQTYLDDAKDGAIYFSLGSNIQSRSISPEKLLTILKSFAKFSQKVLWKFEDENLPNKPENVKIAKWFPQTDILAHPNVKLFITHGGLLSSTEAVFRGVPVIGIPVYGDQYGNIENLVSSGYGQSVTLDDLTEETFTQTIKEVLENARYRETIKKSSKLLKDQPDRPLDRAIFWIEHVIRHNGAKHLRSTSVDLPFYQYLLLDVLGTIIIVFSSIITLLYLVLRKLCCRSTKNVKEMVRLRKIKSKGE